MAFGGAVDVLATEDPDALAVDQEELLIYEKHNNMLHGTKRKRYANGLRTAMQRLAVSQSNSF